MKKILNLSEVPSLTVRHQLTLAAKAVGYSIKQWEGDTPTVADEDGHEFEWKPHLDDGDSRRLQVDLSINVMVTDNATLIAVESNEWGLERYSSGFVQPDDAYSMTRKLVLLCAAVIAGNSFVEGLSSYQEPAQR